MKTFHLTLTITNPILPKPVTHIDVVEAASMSALVKTLELTNKQCADLKANGQTQWMDAHRSLHTLELTEDTDNKGDMNGTNTGHH